MIFERTLIIFLIHPRFYPLQVHYKALVLFRTTMYKGLQYNLAITKCVPALAQRLTFFPAPFSTIVPVRLLWRSWFGSGDSLSHIFLPPDQGQVRQQLRHDRCTT